MEVSFGARVDKNFLKLIHSANLYTKDKPVLRANLFNNINKIRKNSFYNMTYSQVNETANFCIYTRHISSNNLNQPINTRTKGDIYSCFNTDIQKSEKSAFLTIFKFASFLRRFFY